MDFRLRQTWRFGCAFFAALVLGVLLDAVSELPTPRATMATTELQAEPPLPEEVYPESVRQQYLPERNWVLEGITETWKDVAVFDEDGNKIGTKRTLVKEAWFKGRQGPYREGDPLARTGFIIEEIFIDPENGESSVKLKGDMGDWWELPRPLPNRVQPVPSAEREDD